MKKSYFITATGTDIGKTFLTENLCTALKEKDVFAIKPVISGFNMDEESDTKRILRSLGMEFSESNIDKISPYRFKLPLSPDMAARSENKEINFAELISFCHDYINKHDNLFIEGVGGIMVPLNNDKTVLDWILAINIPVILVAGSYLGSISHTLTAMEVLRQNNVDVKMLVISQSEGSAVNIDDMIKTLNNFLDIKIVKLLRGTDVSNIVNLL